jgi:FAD/FMN-containing dehydrogenase
MRGTIVSVVTILYRSKACWLPARCIIRLQDTVEVALALGIVSYFQCQFAVRSGGHKPSPGSGSIGENGILLDLKLMNTISLSGDRRTAIIEPGATWDQVYTVLEKDELNVVGGRVAGVGVGGLILGGILTTPFEVPNY